MRVGVVIAVAAVLSSAACGSKHKDQGPGKDAGAAPAVPAVPKPIPACERYAVALEQSDDLVAQPEVHDLLRDEAALVRAANRAPTEGDRADLTLRCAAGLVDLGEIANDGYGPDAGAPADVDAGVVPSGAGPQCQALLREIARIDGCSDIPDGVRAIWHDRRETLSQRYDETACSGLIDAAERELTQYSCP